MTRAYSTLYHAVFLNHEAIDLGMRISELTSRILRVIQTIQYLYSELSSISHKFAMAQAGILHKQLISRLTFRRLLRKINKSLPTNFKLPFSEPNEYIRLIKTKLIEGADTYHILFYIPLLHTLHAFDIYRFFPYQVPLHEQNVSLSYYPNEPCYLLMSGNRQHYIQPEQSEIESCIIARQPFCALHEPAYWTAGSTSCVTALFKRDPAATRQFCSPVITPATDSPKAYYLTKGQWLMVYKPPFTITIFCTSTQKSTTAYIIRSVDTLQLDPECSASGDSFYLPPYYASETHLELPSLVSTDIYQNSSIPIWRSEWSAKLRNVSTSNVSSLPDLHINGMQADAYFDRLEAQPLEQVTVDSPSAFSKSMLLMIVIGVLTLLCLGFILKYCCPSSSRGTLALARFRSVRPCAPARLP